MGKKTKTPKAPDYSGIATQQAALNEQSWNKGVNAGRPDQFNPMGSVKWGQDPTTGEWTQTAAWNPEQQKTFEAQQAGQGMLAGKTNEAIGGFDTSQMDFSKAPGMPTVGGYNQQAIDTMRALQAPQLEKQRNANQARMAAMGIGTGSGSAWNAEQQNLGTNENQADMQAIMAGINQGNTEFGQRMLAHTTGTSDILNERAGNLGMLSGLSGMQQNLTTPQFAGVGSVGQPGAADLTGASKNAYDAALNKTNASNADKSNNMKTIGTIANIGANIFA